MSTVINLTMAAAERLQKMYQQAPEKKLRIAIKPAGCSGYKYVTELVETIQSSDIKIESAGATFYIDAAAQEVLRGATLDAVSKGLAAWQWEFNNPNVINSCGCGESFSMKEAK